MSKITKPKNKYPQIVLTVEQEHTFHFAKTPAYNALMESLSLPNKPVELISKQGNSIHVHHPVSS